MLMGKLVQLYLPYWRRFGNQFNRFIVLSWNLGQIRLEFIMPDGAIFATKGKANGGTTVMFPSSANTQNLAVNVRRLLGQCNAY
jgi:hypothetical protein